MAAANRQLQQGFTLVELVVAIVLLGTIAVASTQFILQGTTIYLDAAGRDSLQQQGRFTVERISRELRNALPGSVRTNTNAGTQCLEFIPVAAASSYVGRVSDNAMTNVQAINFEIPASFSQIAIYALDEFDVYDSARNAMAAVSSIADPVPSDGLMTIALNPAHQFDNESPTSRFYIVNERVSFCAEDGTLTRYHGYSSSGQAQPVPPVGGASALLAEKIRLIEEDNSAISVFSFTPGSLQRAAVVQMNLVFSDSASLGEEWLRFSQSVFVRNTP